MSKLLTNYPIHSIALLILAAGKSSRLGRAKQLLPLGHTTLLGQTIAVARQTDAGLIFVVLGSAKSLIEAETDLTDLQIVENPQYEEGIASSIRAGLSAIMESKPQTEGILIMVCDQPFISSELIRDLITQQQQNDSPLAVCTYEDTLGTPALFHRSLFSDLLALEGDSGAKKIINTYKDQAAVVSFTAGGIDIDTAEDYKKLIK